MSSPYCGRADRGAADLEYAAFAESWADPTFARPGGDSLLVRFGRTDLDWPFVRAMPMPAIYRLTVGI